MPKSYATECQRVIAGLRQIVNEDGEWTGERTPEGQVASAISRQPSTVRRYLRTLQDLGVVKVERRLTRNSSSMRAQYMSVWKLEKPDAVLVMDNGFLAVQE